jgi:hypothetical protein
MTINEELRQALMCTNPRPRYAYMAPLYRQAKTIAWDYLKHYASPIPGVEFNEAELSATLPNEAKIELLGAQDYNYLRGRYLDGIVLDEYAYMPPEAWTQVIRPALVDRQGWAIFIGTPLGRNHFYELYEKARAKPDVFLTAFWPASLTGIIPDAELEAARADMPPDEYAQEFECSWEAAIRGAYYAKELTDARAAGRLRHVPVDASVPVETWWDLGWDDATAIIFTQTIGREIHVIDYLEARHESLAFYASALQRKGYVYGSHNLPHDADKSTLDGGGKSIITQLRAMFSPLMRDTTSRFRVVPKVEVEEGIQAARRLFSRCWFDETKCRRLLDCLANYRQEWNKRLQSFGSKPRHDEWSHGADAFRYFGVGHRPAATGPVQQKAHRDWNPYPSATFQRTAVTR